MNKWKFAVLVISFPLWILPVGIYALYKIWEDEFAE